MRMMANDDDKKNMMSFCFWDLCAPVKYEVGKQLLFSIYIMIS